MVGGERRAKKAEVQWLLIVLSGFLIEDIVLIDFFVEDIVLRVCFDLVGLICVICVNLDGNVDLGHFIIAVEDDDWVGDGVSASVESFVGDAYLGLGRLGPELDACSLHPVGHESSGRRRSLKWREMTISCSESSEDLFELDVDGSSRIANHRNKVL